MSSQDRSNDGCLHITKVEMVDCEGSGGGGCGAIVGGVVVVFFYLT